MALKGRNFDVIVVGAGHAGIEAGLASARLGCRTLQITTRLDRIGYMSCNPAIGGLAKGHMVREIDVLGGEMGLATDATCIQFKRLNANRGPAVRGSRAQCDKDLYSSYMRDQLEKQENLELLEDEVKALILEDSRCAGVRLSDGSEIRSRTVVITAGTFMNGVMHIGAAQTSGGRVGDRASVGLSDQLKAFGFQVQRLKTGTPPRLLRSSIDWSKTTPEWGDEEFFAFSFRGAGKLSLPQVACHITYTNEQTHEVLRQNLHRSPIYGGIIEGIGPRYCPSIEDKICRFADRDRHQTFLEPESLSTDLIYLQGISTSMPEDVQDMFLKTIPGLENVKVVRYGYAVEYDFVEPTQIKHSLETRGIEGLFLAGQVNGTSGYEEAAGQGLIAGINAARKVKDLEPLVLKRSEAYTGVLIDDLVTKGTREPYRMFTSRAEHRLILREDNTLERLASLGREIGLLGEADYARATERIESRQALVRRLEEVRIFPNPETQAKLSMMGTSPLLKPASLADLLRRPEVSSGNIIELLGAEGHSSDTWSGAEIDIKYSGYIERQAVLVEQAERLESLKIPKELDFARIVGLSKEEVEKLARTRPDTLGQASRISGINPSAIQAILIYLKAHKQPIESTTKVRRNDRYKPSPMASPGVVSETL